MISKHAAEMGSSGNGLHLVTLILLLRTKTKCTVAKEPWKTPISTQVVRIYP